MVASNFPRRPFRLEGGAWLISQNVGANTSYVGGDLWIRKNSYSPTYSLGNNSSFTFRLNGAQVAGWAFAYDFRNSNELRLCYSETTVGHSADGTKSFAVDGYANVDIMGYTEIHGVVGLPTIPRASTATWAVPGNAVAGVAKTLNTNRASAGFTHDIDYYFGNTTGRALTGVGASGSWTPPMSLLNQMTDAAVKDGRLRTHTYNGGSMIGWTESTFRLEAGPEIVPTWSSAVVGPRTSEIPETVGGVENQFRLQLDVALNSILAGGYIQRMSRVRATINDAAGVYGSTIASYTQQLEKQVMNARDVGFFDGIQGSGTIPITQTITDTRGRTKTQVTNINVMPYTPPVVTNFSVERCNADGTDNPTGTAVRVKFDASAQSIVVNGVEKNRAKADLVYGLNGNGTDLVNVVPASATLQYMDKVVVLPGPFAVDKAYYMRLEWVDGFDGATSTKTLGTAEIFQHWGTGLGVGKYWERGMLDVFGDIYSSGGVLSLGKRVTNADQATREGRYHMNNTNGNGPIPGPNGVSTGNGQLIIDVETWYEVQNGSVFHYIRQRAYWISSRASNDSRRNAILSLQNGYTMTRISTNGGFSWSDWATEDPRKGLALAWTQGAATAPDPISGRYNFIAGTQRTILFDNVFPSDATAVQVDYYYRTGDNNSNYFRLRSGGATPSLTYSTQHVYVTGTGTPAALQQNSVAQGQMGVNPTDVHAGQLTIFNVGKGSAGLVKSFKGTDIGAANAAISTYGGVMGGSAGGITADNTAFDGFLISTYDNKNLFSQGWIRFTTLY